MDALWQATDQPMMHHLSTLDTKVKGWHIQYTAPRTTKIAFPAVMQRLANTRIYIAARITSLTALKKAVGFVCEDLNTSIATGVVRSLDATWQHRCHSLRRLQATKSEVCNECSIVWRKCFTSTALSLK